MAQVGALVINVAANTGQFRAGMSKASADVTRFGAAVHKSHGTVRMFGSALAMSAGFGALAGMGAMVKGAKDFASEMNRSLAIMDNVGPRMRAEMERTAKAVAASTQFSAKGAASAYFFLASAGMDAKASLAALPAVSRFAQAGNFSLAQATDLATDAQSALGLKSRDAAVNLKNLTHVTDVLVKANALANASVLQFSQSLTTKAAVQMRLYGIRIEEGSAALAAFADQGIKGALAGTKLHIVLRDLTTKAIQNSAAFERLGVAVFKLGEVRKIADILADFEKRFAGLDDRARKSTLLELGFTDKSVAGLQALIGYSDQIREWEAALMAAGGTTDDISDRVLTKFDKAWNRLAATLTTIASDIFPPILDGLADIANAATKGTEGVDGLTDELKPERTSAKIGKSIGAYVWGAKKWAGTPELAIGQAIYAASRFMGPLLYQAGSEKSDEYLAQHDRQWKEIQERFGEIGMPEIEWPVPKERRGAAGRLRRMRADLDRMDPPGMDALAKRMAAKRAEQYGPPSMFGAEFKAKVEAEKELAAEWEKTLEANRAMWEEFDLNAAKFKAEAWAKTQAEEQRKWNIELAETARLFDLTRTAEEKFTAGVADLERLLTSGALDDPAVAARRFGQLSKELGDASRAKQPSEQQLLNNPAIVRGSQEAFDLILRNSATNRMRDPAEEAAKAAMEVAKAFPKLLEILLAIKNDQHKPGTVEVAP